MSFARISQSAPPIIIDENIKEKDPIRWRKFSITKWGWMSSQNGNLFVVVNAIHGHQQYRLVVIDQLYSRLIADFHLPVNEDEEFHALVQIDSDDTSCLISRISQTDTYVFRILSIPKDVSKTILKQMYRFDQNVSDLPCRSQVKWFQVKNGILMLFEFFRRLVNNMTNFEVVAFNGSHYRLVTINLTNKTVDGMMLFSGGLELKPCAECPVFAYDGRLYQPKGGCFDRPDFGHHNDSPNLVIFELDSGHTTLLPLMMAEDSKIKIHSPSSSVFDCTKDGALLMFESPSIFQERRPDCCVCRLDLETYQINKLAALPPEFAPFLGSDCKLFSYEGAGFTLVIWPCDDDRSEICQSKIGRKGRFLRKIDGNVSNHYHTIKVWHRVPPLSQLAFEKLCSYDPTVLDMDKEKQRKIGIPKNFRKTL